MTVRYLIISILFIAVSFFIGYSINPYNQVEEMKNQMVTIIMPNGTGIEGTRKDTIFIADYVETIIDLKYLAEVHRLAYMQGVNACIVNATFGRSFDCKDLVQTHQYKEDSVFVLSAFKIK